MNYQITETLPGTKVDQQSLGKILYGWENNPTFLIEILQDIQEQYHYLPREALEYTSGNLKVPLSQIYHIATFFKGLSLVPRGEHLIQVCMGTACHVQGAPRILDQIERELDVKQGHNTKDLKYSLEAVRCIGCCGLAAVVTVDKDLYSQVKPAKVSRIFKKYE